jgi:hypothetical protein
MTALGHAIEHLQIVIFVEDMETLAADLGSESALRESVLRYEQGLARLFGFVRASGALPDAVAWSMLKVDTRRAAHEAGVEITLRTALETGMYNAESVPLGDHGRYRAWSSSVTEFLSRRTMDAPVGPSGSSEEERLLWAYEVLADLEDHESFHCTLLEHVRTGGALEGDTVEVVADLQSRLLALPRFDLVLNACLLWLADHGRRDESHAP